MRALCERARSKRIQTGAPMRLVQKIQQMFPEPVHCPPYGTELTDTCGYCIGGAIVQYAVRVGVFTAAQPVDLHFPFRLSVSEALQALNPELPEELADMYGDLIVDNNDNDEFVAGWEIAGEALSYGQLIH